MKIGNLEVFRFEELAPKLQQKILDQEREFVVLPEWWDYLENELKQYLEQQGFEFDKMEFDGFYSQGDGARISLTLKIDAEGEGENTLSSLILRQLREPDAGNENVFNEYPAFFPKILDKDPTLLKLMDYLSTNKYTDYRGKAPMGRLRIAVYPDAYSRYYHENTLTSENDPDVDWQDEFWNEDAIPEKHMTHEEFMNNAVCQLEENILNWTQGLSRELFHQLEKTYEGMTCDESVRETLQDYGPEWAEGYVWNAYGHYVGHMLIHPLEEEC